MMIDPVLLQQVINGLSLGAMYALLALGFTLVYGILELINFAHFNVFMVSSFIGMWALEMLGISGQSTVLGGFALVGTLVFAFVVTMLSAGVLGVAIERIALRPLRNARGTAAMITTIGVSYILFNVILLTAGASSFNFPNPMPSVRWDIGGATLQLREVLIWTIAVVLMLGLHLFVNQTRLGKAMRATAQDPEAARMMGIDVDRVIITAFFLGSALAGAAALIFGLYYNFTSFIIGYTAGLRAFTAAVLGGIGSITGAMVGGVLIGLIESLGGHFFATRWADVIIFSILVLVLVFMPSGLFGLAGLLDLGYAAFFAIGAYTYGAAASWQITPDWSSFWEPFQWLGLVAHFHEAGEDVVHFQVSFWLMMPIAAAATAFFGVLFGFPTLRLKGDYLAIVTLGFGEIVPIVARNTPSVTNGAMGLNGVAAPQLFGWSFGVDATPYYYVGLALVAFLILTSQRLKFSRIGRAWMAIREDELAAAAMGVNRTKMKLLAFATGAAFAGATGTLFVAKLQTATPEMFGFPVSVMILVMIVFGGIGSVWGVVLGALILQLLQSWFLQDLSGWLHSLGRLINVEWLQHIELASSIELIFGLILVLMMLYRREGLIPATRRVAPLTTEEQTAAPTRGGFEGLKGLGAVEERGSEIGRAHV